MACMEKQRKGKRRKREYLVHNYTGCEKEHGLVVFVLSLLTTRWHQLVFTGSRLSVKELLLWSTGLGNALKGEVVCFSNKMQKLSK